MKLVVLHGPPASGKFTIAKALEAQIGARVFHNHLTLDVAKPLFEFGTQAFWELVVDLRLTCLTALMRHGTGTVIWTWCYDHPSDLKFFEQIERIAYAEHAALIPVYLQCSVEELERRVSAPSRHEMRKLTSVTGLHKTLSRWNCVAIPRDNCVVVRTDERSPSQCTKDIIERVGLSR